MNTKIKFNQIRVTFQPKRRKIKSSNFDFRKVISLKKKKKKLYLITNSKQRNFFPYKNQKKLINPFQNALNFLFNKIKLHNKKNK